MTNMTLWSQGCSELVKPLQLRQGCYKLVTRLQGHYNLATTLPQPCHFCMGYYTIIFINGLDLLLKLVQVLVEAF